MGPQGIPSRVTRGHIREAEIAASILLEGGLWPEGCSPVPLVTPATVHPAEVLRRAVAANYRVFERGNRRSAYLHIWAWTSQEIQPGCARGHLARQRRRRRRHVLDLRDGWGGAWPQYLSIFMREVPVLEKVDRDGAVQGVDPQLRKPAAVLVNGGTRSGRGASLCHQEAPAGSPGRRAGGRAHPGAARRSHRGEAADDCQSGAGPGPANTALGRPTEGRLGPREAIRALVRLDEGPRAARPNRWEPASRPGVRAPGFRTRRGRWNRSRSPKVL